MIDNFRGIAVGDFGNNLLITIFHAGSLTPMHNFIIDANNKNLSNIVATDVKVLGGMVFISGFKSIACGIKKGIFLSFKVEEFSSFFLPTLLARHETNNEISGNERFNALDVTKKKVYLTGEK